MDSNGVTGAACSTQHGTPTMQPRRLPVGKCAAQVIVAQHQEIQPARNTGGGQIDGQLDEQCWCSVLSGNRKLQHFNNGACRHASIGAKVRSAHTVVPSCKPSYTWYDISMLVSHSCKTAHLLGSMMSAGKPPCSPIAASHTCCRGPALGRFMKACQSVRFDVSPVTLVMLTR